ncbi:MAG: hypothetical protein FWD17_18190 [Polyangiaceae bacterium]|nr:hypothetical protein [Polyangiaceae bacterium]
MKTTQSLKADAIHAVILDTERQIHEAIQAGDTKRVKSLRRRLAVHIAELEEVTMAA